jgi:hypothetical protein
MMVWRVGAKGGGAIKPRDKKGTETRNGNKSRGRISPAITMDTNYYPAKEQILNVGVLYIIVYLLRYHYHHGLLPGKRADFMAAFTQEPSSSSMRSLPRAGIQT